MRRALAVALGALAAAGALAQEPEGAGVPPPAPAPAAEAAPDVAALNPLAALDKNTLTGFRDMPLFTPSRKRPEEPVVEAEAPEPEPAPPPAPSAAEPELKLSGVVEGPDGAVAIVQKDGETERLRLGDQVDGWLVTGIEGFTLKLTLNEREKEYRLFQRSEASAKPKGDDEGDGPEGGKDTSGDEMSGEDQGGRDQSVDQPEGEPADRPEGQPQPDRPEGEQPEGEAN